MHVLMSFTLTSTHKIGVAIGKMHDLEIVHGGLERSTSPNIILSQFPFECLLMAGAWSEV
jgi:tRNA A-37 threonylcarbamoyl transferase component Bud32